MNEWNNRITIAIILLLGVLVIGQRLPKQKGESLRDSFASGDEVMAIASGAVQPIAPAPNSGSPRLLKFNLSVSSPKDLKVRQGDRVSVGYVLADRVEERSRLTSQQQTLKITLNQIQSREIPKPPLPIALPTVKNLPPISYVEEEATIQAAAINVQLAERAFQLQQESLKTQPLEETSAVTMASVKVENQQRLMNNQQRMVDGVATIKDLPPSVTIHEREVLKQREAELQQAQAEYQQANAKLSTALAARNEKLTLLAAGLQKAKAEQQLATAKLQTKRDQRAFTEYEASVTAVRRAEEKNQAQQSYYRQLQEFQQQERDRSFQLAQLNSKLAEVDNQLSTLSTVTSPYAGTIRRVKILQQNDNNLSVELTLVVGGEERDRSAPIANTSTTGQPATSPFNSSPFTSNSNFGASRSNR